MSEVTGLHSGEEYRVEVLGREEVGNCSSALDGVVKTELAFADTFGYTVYSDILGMSGSGVTRGCNPPERPVLS